MTIHIHPTVTAKPERIEALQRRTGGLVVIGGHNPVLVMPKARQPHQAASSSQPPLGGGDAA